MEPKWRMSRKALTEDQLFSKLDISKFQNVSTLQLNKWKEEKQLPLPAHKISIKEVMFKNNIEINTTETTGCKTQLELSMSLLLTSALLIQNILINQMIWKL